MTRKCWGNCDFHISQPDGRKPYQSALQASKARLENYLLSTAKRCAKHRNKSDRYRKLKAWAISVKNRDVLCQHCGVYENLHAHHIKPKHQYPEIMFDLDNGVLLCHKCHANAHKNDKVWNLMMQSCG